MRAWLELGFILITLTTLLGLWTAYRDLRDERDYWFDEYAAELDRQTIKSGGVIVR